MQGAGTGRYALKLARRGWNVTALDANREMLSIANDAAVNEGLSIEFIQGRIEDGVPVQSGIAVDTAAGTAYFGVDDGRVVAVDIGSGTVLWTFQTGSTTPSSGSECPGPRPRTARASLGS